MPGDSARPPRPALAHPHGPARHRAGCCLGRPGRAESSRSCAPRLLSGRARTTPAPALATAAGAPGTPRSAAPGAAADPTAGAAVGSAGTMRRCARPTPAPMPCVPGGRCRPARSCGGYAPSSGPAPLRSETAWRRPCTCCSSHTPAPSTRSGRPTSRAIAGRSPGPGSAGSACGPCGRPGRPTARTSASVARGEAGPCCRPRSWPATAPARRSRRPGPPPAAVDTPRSPHPAGRTDATAAAAPSTASTAAHAAPVPPDPGRPPPADGIARRPGPDTRPTHWCPTGCCPAGEPAGRSPAGPSHTRSPDHSAGAPPCAPARSRPSRTTS